MFLSVVAVLVLAPLVICQLDYPFGFSSQKEGDCPPPPSLRICEITCDGDWSCGGNAKCCKTACGGNACLNPVTKTRVWSNPGNCPKPSGPWVCTHRCRYDSDCGRKRKCCRNRCGALACIKPELDDDNEIPLDV